MPESTPARRPSRGRLVLWIVMSIAMMVVGVLHFVSPAGFVRIVPSFLPAPLALVYASGVAEILGGAGLLIRPVRRAAAFGLIALYVAVFPANINMAVNHLPLGDGPPPPAVLLWLRLPLQALFIWWAYKLAQEDRPKPRG